MTRPLNPSNGQADLNYSGGQLFDWVEGMPRPRKSRGMGKEQILSLHNAAAAIPYQGVWNPLTQKFEIEPQYKDLTQAEVAILRVWQKAAEGDIKAYEKLMDRIAGKPKQAVETVSMKLSYQEVLDMMAAQDKAEGIYQEVDVEVVDECDPQPAAYIPGSIFTDPEIDFSQVSLDDLDDLDELLEGV